MRLCGGIGKKYKWTKRGINIMDKTFVLKFLSLSFVASCIRLSKSYDEPTSSAPDHLRKCFLIEGLHQTIFPTVCFGCRTILAGRACFTSLLPFLL